MGFFFSSASTSTPEASTGKRGFSDCISIGQDCTDQTTNYANTAFTSVTWPMKKWKVDFPCTDGFKDKPMVFAKIKTSAQNKMFGVSVRDVTTKSFGINVQRLDDVPDGTYQEPCSDVQVCYLALAGF